MCMVLCKLFCIWYDIVYEGIIMLYAERYGVEHIQRHWTPATLEVAHFG